jgi:hypothetical protein
LSPSHPELEIAAKLKRIAHIADEVHIDGHLEVDTLTLPHIEVFHSVNDFSAADRFGANVCGDTAATVNYFDAPDVAAIMLAKLVNFNTPDDPQGPTDSDRAYDNGA